MVFYFYSHTYCQYGGSNVFSPVGDLLQLRLADYGEAIQTFSILAYLRSATYNPRPTLEGLFKQHHDHLTKLPTISFHRKLRKVKIDFESRATNAEDEESRRYSLDATNAAMQEFITILPLLEKRLKKSDDFDYPCFVTDATRLLTQGFASEDEIRLVSAQAREQWKAERATKSPWELLEIDWDKFHPKAREILDEPFYWDCANDFAPHGNDTGADLLADYCKWVRLNRQASPMTFLSRLFAGWGIVPIDWNLTDEEEVRELMETKGTEVFLSNQAIVALAFAVLKVKGKCPHEVADMALKALQRDGFAFMEDRMEEKNKVLHREAIAKMRAKLQRR